MSRIAENKDVDYRFKILYAVGIIMVVAGHCNNGGFSLLYEWFQPFSFHLGIFVFSSGYFYKDKEERDLFNYIKRKIRNLLVPLYLWNSAYALLVIISAKLGFTIGGGQDMNAGKLLYAVLLSPVLDGHSLVYNMGGWFVMPLFSVEVLNACLRKLLRWWKGAVKEVFLFVFYFILGSLGVCLAEKIFTMGTVGDISSVSTTLAVVVVRILYFMPFYGLGIFYRKILEKYDRLSSFFYFLWIFIAQYIIILICGYAPGYIPSWGQIYSDGPILPYIAGYLGIALWLRIAKILEPVVGHSKWINVIADNSFSIMVNHALGFMAIKGIFAICKKVFGIFDAFDMNSFKTNVAYIYCPRGVEHFLIFYVAAGIAFAVILQQVVDWIKGKMILKALK